MASTLSYGWRVFRDRLRFPPDRRCPYCASGHTVPVGRKHLILQLRECENCGLKYRYPKDAPVAAWHYYQRSYQEPTVTDLPSLAELSVLRDRDFVGSRFDKTEKVELLVDILGEGRGTARVLDYGASFGYMMWQLRRRGVPNIRGYEISLSRAAYGREHLNLAITSSAADVLAGRGAGYAVIYSSHVLEHLAEPAVAIRLMAAAVHRPRGRIVIWAPNASGPALARHYGGSWRQLVGEPHPLALDYAFLEYALPQYDLRVVGRGDPSDSELYVVAEAE